MNKYYYKKGAKPTLKTKKKPKNSLNKNQTYDLKKSN